MDFTKGFSISDYTVKYKGVVMNPLFIIPFFEGGDEIVSIGVYYVDANRRLKYVLDTADEFAFTRKR